MNLNDKDKEQSSICRMHNDNLSFGRFMKLLLPRPLQLPQSLHDSVLSNTSCCWAVCGVWWCLAVKHQIKSKFVELSGKLHRFNRLMLKYFTLRLLDFSYFWLQHICGSHWSCGVSRGVTHWRVPGFWIGRLFSSFVGGCNRPMSTAVDNGCTRCSTSMESQLELKLNSKFKR